MPTDPAPPRDLIGEAQAAIAGLRGNTTAGADGQAAIAAAVLAVADELRKIREMTARNAAGTVRWPLENIANALRTQNLDPPPSY